MIRKSTWTGLLVLVVLAQETAAQSPPTAVTGTLPSTTKESVTDSLPAEANWRPTDVNKQREAGAASPLATLDAQRMPTATPAVPIRSGGKDMLPNDQGQVWQQYDISAYTSHVKGTENPEQAIVEWILRETGTEVWFKPPLGLLSATNATLSVYHTPEMQKVVADVIGRFVNGTQDPHVLGLRVVAVDNPSWRSLFLNRLRPVTVQSTGIDAWLLSKEDAALLLAELRRRTDFREHAAQNLVFFNGQSQAVANLRPRVYVKSYRTRTQDNTWMGYDVERGQLQEGFTLQVSPLLSQDERTIDVVLKCSVDQVEKFVNVAIDLPGFNGQVQRADIQVPQLVSWRLHERFRWSSNQVLLLSCGVIASAGPNHQTTLGIPNPFSRGGGRADALLFVESLGKASQALIPSTITTAGSEALQPGARY
ncbi:MAG: hypothetical protein ACYC6N_09055 [Pirellulaceae bacterium]